MRDILQHRGLRWIFVANLISMAGSGMNSAAVTWFLLQATHSETSLGELVVLQTIPALLLLPFSGVIIDRQDRRRLVMLLDSGRAAVVLTVAVLALRGQAQVWQLYLMGMLVAAGFWMFWPTLTALIQELTPESEFVHSNTFLLAGVQGGWLIAGSVVGFVYNKIGLGGVLLIDFATYAASFGCYFLVRKGRVVVEKPSHLEAQAREIEAAKGAWGRYLHELREGLEYVKKRPFLMLMGSGWALFIGGMLSQGVVTAPLSDRVLHSGAVGYGWLNAAWGIGAFVSTLYSAWMIRRSGGRGAFGIGMALLAVCLFLLPLEHWLIVACVGYFVMGSARGFGGVGVSTLLMEWVPKHIMGRVQNTFYFAGTILQLTVGYTVGVVSHRIGLTWGFWIVALMYAVAALTTVLPVEQPRKAAAGTATAD